MRAILIMILLVFSGIVIAESYENPFTRPGNFTINYSKIPWVLLGVTPQLTPPLQREYDKIEPVNQIVRLDPRTCPGEIAHCYQIRRHNFTGEITGGKNYTAISNYVLPERRIKMYVCIGNDTSCVSESTNCFCPEQEVPEPPHIIGRTGKCSDDKHLCRNTYAGFVFCYGNFSSCVEKHGECACGRYGVCVADRRNTCINTRNELTVCGGTFQECVGKYSTCFCGTEIMKLQSVCTSRTHNCTLGTANVTCLGPFEDCALKHDTCDC